MMILFISLILIILALCSYFLIGNYHANYWRKRGVSFHEKNILFGPLWDYLFTDRSLFQILHDIYKMYPNEPAVGLQAFMRPTIYVKHPKNIQHVLQADFKSFSHRGFDIYQEEDVLADNILFMNGNRWKLMRQAMTPLFTTAKLKDMYYILDKSAKDFVDYLKDDPSKLKENIFNTLCTFCSAAIGAAVFGINTKSVFESPFLDMAVNSFKSTTSGNLKIALANLNKDALKTFRLQLFPEYKDFFIGAVKQVIRQREKENIKKHDFADICVTLQKNGKLKDTETGYELEPTDELLAAQAFFFFIAGVKPTASAMYAVFIELGRNPEILKKVQDEIDTVWGKCKGSLTHDNINEMEYLDKVLSESLRMYPPIGVATRLCVRDSVLPEGNIKISKGTKIFAAMYELHHDSKYYANPEVFDPERFSHDNKNNDPTYLAFGKGGRICIGMRYARLQAKAGLFYVLKEFSPVTNVPDGGVQFSKNPVQVRPMNINIQFVPRKIKHN